MIFEFFKKLFWRADGSSRKRKSYDCYEHVPDNFPKKYCTNSTSSVEILNNNEFIDTAFDDPNKQYTFDRPLQVHSGNYENNDTRMFELSEFPAEWTSSRRKISYKNNVASKGFETSYNSSALKNFTLYKAHQIIDRQKYSHMLLNFVTPNIDNLEQKQGCIDNLKKSKRSRESGEQTYTYSTHIVEHGCEIKNNSIFSYPCNTHFQKSYNSIAQNSKFQPSCKTDLKFSTDSDTIFVPKNDSKTNSLKVQLATKQVIKENFITQLTEKYNISLEQHRKEAEEIKNMTQILAKHNRLTREAALENHLNRSMRLCEAVLDETDLFEFKLPQLDSNMMKKIDSALSPGPVNEVLVQEFGLKITRKDVQTLNGLNWLNDEVINFYMNLLIKRGNSGKYPAVYAMNTFFYPKLISGGHKSLKRWTRKIDIFSKDLIVVPIHLGIHWCISIIDFRNKTVQYYDSMGSPNYKCLQVLKQYLQDESVDKKNKSFEFLGWNFECMKSIPQQMNGSDCGVFSCVFAEYICAGRKLDFTQDDMPYFRKKMVYEILSIQLL